MEERKVTTHKNIYIALAAAQTEMGPVVKGAVNPHFRSRYADLADVMQVALPALNKHGIAAWHSTTSADGATIMRTTLSHGESDTHINCDVPMIVAKNDMQGMKSATTYAKRIGIESLTGIAPEDDDGNAAGKAAPKQKPAEPQRPSDQAISEAMKYISEAKSLDELKERWINLPEDIRDVKSIVGAKDSAKERLTSTDNADLGGDELTY